MSGRKLCGCARKPIGGIITPQREVSPRATQVLEKIAERVRLCTRCVLRETATQPVPGLGDIDAKYFIIGEAAGREEDSSGIPFVGLAGRRLNKLLALAGIPLNDCYITNVCKCRPPNNRTPRKSERLACFFWLKRELTAIKPKSIIVLGSTALSLFTDVGVRQLHGTQFSFDLPVEKWAEEVKNEDG